MEPVRHPPPAVASDASSPRPLAVVTPLFKEPGTKASWAPVTVELRGHRRAGWVLALAIGLALFAVAVVRSAMAERRVAARLEAGCLDVDDCRALVQTAETAADSCWVGCASHADLVSRARARFRGALELAAHQERKRQDDDYEQGLATRRHAEAVRVDREHEQRLVELDRQHRHELALLAAETERLREQKVQQQLQRVAYLRQLSRPQRLARLTTCHQRGANCDDLMLALSSAAASETERAELIDTHERHVTGNPRPAPQTYHAPLASPAPVAATLEANSNAREPAPL